MKVYVVDVRTLSGILITTPCDAYRIGAGGVWIIVNKEVVLFVPMSQIEYVGRNIAKEQEIKDKNGL